MKELIDKIWNMPSESLLLIGAKIAGVIVAIWLIIFLIRIIAFKRFKNKHNF